PGHSLHGEAFNEGPRRAAYLMGGTGEVHFPVTTKNAEAQKFFEQGVGQLHGFWYFEAERSFRQALALDPDCVMAYWGMTMANTNNGDRARKFLAEAVKRKEQVSPREKMWIEALEAYYPPADQKKSEADRWKAYLDRLEKIVYEHDDLEARSFVALGAWSARGQVPLSSHLAVDALLGEVFAASPMHPSHHYRIHLWDDERAERAVKSAALCGQTSPICAHMWHMPGHIFSKLERYSDAAWQQEAGARADHAYMVRDNVAPYQIHNYAHNSEWLIRSWNALGRPNDSLRLASNLIGQPRHPDRNEAATRGHGAHFGRIRLLETLAQFELWQAALDADRDGLLEPQAKPADEAERLAVLGAAAFHQGDATRGDELLAKIETQAETLRQERDKAGREAEEKSRKEHPNDDGKAKTASDNARRGFDGRIKEVEQSADELRGWKLAIAGDWKPAAEAFEKANAAKSLRARAWAEAGDSEKALKLAQEAVAGSKKHVLPLANLAFVQHRVGKKTEAGETMKKLVEQSAELDLTAPPFARLSSLAQEMGLASDWRAPKTTAPDVGVRPALDSLGPVNWRPTRAPDWTLAASDGQSVSRSDFAGRPVVLIFYLGGGCLHCTQQLQAFADWADKYEAAGISLVGVSTDSPTQLAETLSPQAAPNGFPFPLASDEPLQVFKSFGVHDDFESQPLHGTFLIDGDGLIRWRDVSYEPFAKPEFLLDEAQRLLALPTARVYGPEAGPTSSETPAATPSVNKAAEVTVPAPAAVSAASDETASPGATGAAAGS
ncbi:MAG TPA: redoxin domain-containing protein, partial [Pirellulales bacterium]